MKVKTTSEYSGFYKLTPKERIEYVAKFANLTPEECDIIQNLGGISLDQAEHMVENVIGTIRIPLGLGMNFLINGKDYLIPMATEEPSVVAAASHASKIARIKGGFKTSSTDSLMIGQIQVLDIIDSETTKEKIMKNKDLLLKIANEQDPILTSFGGGAKDIEIRILDSDFGKMLIVHLIVDTKDAMGANAVNTMVEALSLPVEEMTGGRVLLKILSNLAVYRLAKAKAVFSKEKLGEKTISNILEAAEFARVDPYRAATHNKGIMNGISSLILATGNDTRAIEAGAHAYASISGKYTSLTKWSKNESGDLVGSIELPMAVGIIGGATKTHPVAKLAIKILGIKTAKELAEVAATLGLAQNFAAIRALATEGIQKGHMALHARNIAIMAGAKGEQVQKVTDLLVKEGKIRLNEAERILSELK
ncbi:MAG: hydroxymethylglutaryl-CoA reductase, degradative [Candidatus Ranarchaeia archaeon]